MKTSPGGRAITEVIMMGKDEGGNERRRTREDGKRVKECCSTERDKDRVMRRE